MTNNSTTPKRYRLKKDISTFDVEAKAGCIGIERVDPDQKVWFDNGRFYFMRSTIEKWPDWFEEIKEPERIEVEILQEYGSSLKHHVSDNGFYHPYSLRVYKNELPKHKLPAIKEAIEIVLNEVKEDSNCVKVTFSLLDTWESSVGILKDVLISSGVKVHNPPSESELDKARREGFNAGQLLNQYPDFANSKYRTYEDYINSLK